MYRKFAFLFLISGSLALIDTRDLLAATTTQDLRNGNGYSNAGTNPGDLVTSSDFKISVTRDGNPSYFQQDTTGIYLGEVADTGMVIIKVEPVSSGATFDLTAVDIEDAFDYDNFVISITGHQASGEVSGPTDSGDESTVNIYNLPIPSNFTGLQYFTITYATTSSSPALADLTFVSFDATIVDIPPTFVGSTTTLSVNQNAGATDITDLLHASDSDSGQTLTWTQATAPSHGALNFSNATASTGSGSTDITPGGTLTYTPATGYAGTDSFTVQVSDGTATATRTISVSVTPLAPSTPDLDDSTDTGSNATDDKTAGIFGGTLLFKGTVASSDDTSLLTIFLDSNSNGSCDNVESHSNVSVGHGGTYAATLGLGELSDGTYNVYAFTSNGAFTSPLSGALSITIDRTAPTAGTVTANNVTTSGGTSYTFTVAYSDSGTGIDSTSISSGDVTVKKGSTSLTVGTPSYSSGVATYTVTPPGGSWDSSDEGTYTIAIVANEVKDIAGNAVAANTSAATFSVSANSAPVNGTIPSISGTAKVGNALNTSNGTWTDADNDLLTYSYQWYRADSSSGSNETAISGETGSSYTLTTTDAHKYIKVVVTADDSQSHTSAAASSYTAVSNNAPAITGAAAGQTVNDDATAAPFSNVTFTDGDGDNLTITVSLDAAAKGAFTSVSLTASGFTDQGSGSYRLASSSASAATTAIRGLVYVPTEDRVAVGSTETTTFSIVADDGIGFTTDATTTLASTSVNDAPTVTNNGSTTLSGTDEDTDSTATLVSAILSGGTVGYADVDTGASSGIAVTGVTANGNWQYSSNGGSTWSNLGTVSAAAALLLPSTAQVRFHPDGNNGETASFTFRAWDQTSGTALSTADTGTSGNTTAFSANAASATITVTSVNDAPVLANAIPSQSGGYGGDFSYTVAANTFSDVDTGDTITWSASGLPSGLSINATTRVISGTLTAAGTYTVTITGTDSGNAHADAVFTLTVNKAPLIIKADDQVMTYGDTVPELTATYTGLVNGDVIASIPEAVSISTTGTPTSNVGTYPIFVSGGSSPNYTIQRVQGTLTINKTKLTVKADDKSRKYQVSNPTLTGVVTGAKNGEVIQVTYSTSATASSPVGDYPIVPSVSSRQKGISNYDLTIINGTLTVLDLADLPGVAHDGYVAGGTVFFDANNNRSLDPGEPSTTTDDSGQFNIAIKVSDFDKNKDGKLDTSEGALVLVGGIDISTGLPVQASLVAPYGSTVLNPLTTLVTAALDQNPSLSVGEAESSIASALGIPGVALTQYDAIGAAQANDPGATAVVNAGAKVQDSLVQVAAVISASGASDATRTVAEVLSSAALSGSLDLSQTATVQQVIAQSASSSGVTINNQVQGQVAQVIAQGNQVKDQIASGGGDASDIALEISRKQGVTQGEVAAALQQAVSAGNSADAQKIIDDAKQQVESPAPVGVITGEDVRPGFFNFGQAEFEIKDLVTQTAPVSVFRTDGNKGEATVVLALSRGDGDDAVAIPLVFANREIRKTVDVLGLVRTNQLLLGVDEVALHLLLSQNASTNQAGLGETNRATLVLRSAPGWTAQPVDTDSFVGGRATLRAIASGSPKPVYQWYKDGVALTGQTSYELALDPTSLSDSGKYYATASNVVRVITSQRATLNVLASPVVSQSTTNKTVIAGTAVSLTVEALGSSPLSYQWKRNGVVVGGQNGATLQLSRADETDTGDYTVTVSNAYGVASVPVGHLEVLKPNLAILAMSLPVNGRMVVPLQGPVGQRARLEASVDFVNWVMVTDVTFKENWVDYVETEFSNLPKRFYRLIAEAP